VADIARIGGLGGLQVLDRELVGRLPLREARLRLREIDLGALADLQPIVGRTDLRVEERDVVARQRHKLLVLDDREVSGCHGEQHRLLGALQSVAAGFGRRARRLDVGIALHVVEERLVVSALEADRGSGRASARACGETAAHRAARGDRGQLLALGDGDAFGGRLDLEQRAQNVGVVEIGAGECLAQGLCMGQRRN